MIVSLRERIGLLFVAFFALITISVGATFLAIEAQQKDALIINLAGRQRMLLQAMTRHALELASHSQEPFHRAALVEAVTTFESTRQALERGGPAPYVPGQQVVLPPPRDPAVREALAQVRARWTSMEAMVKIILTTAPNTSAFQQAVTALEEQSLPLVQAMDEAVRAFERTATAKVHRLRLIQSLFLTVAALLVLLGYGLLYRMVVRPLRLLQGVAAEIGRGKLARPVPMLGRDEIAQLAQSLESMRRCLQAAHEDLEAQVAQRTRELEALYEVSREISSRLEIEHVLRSVTGKARELLDGEVAVLCLLDQERGTLTMEAFSGPEQALRGIRMPAQSPLTAQVLVQERALSCGLDNCIGWCSVLSREFQESHLAAPLRVGDRTIGALCIGSRQARQFSSEATRLLTRLANVAAIALENARLYAQAERIAILEERQRIAAEMHDGLAQTLGFLGLKVDQITELIEGGNARASAIAELQHLRTVIDQASQEVRHAITSLQEESLAPESLCDRLKKMVEELAMDGEGPPVQLMADSAASLHLSHGEAEQVVHVVREALMNARRHARASRIWIRLERKSEKEIAVVVEDDGCGFVPEAVARQAEGHFGLHIMRARAARLGGQVIVDSAPGQGTRVVLTWPLAGGQSTG
jgi:two-component system nitrate/nitrite sensor histidine kinase NarX